jgi:hypothetical protein
MDMVKFSHLSIVDLDKSHLTFIILLFAKKKFYLFLHRVELNVIYCVIMANFVAWERSSIGRALLGDWMKGTGIDTSRFQVAFTSIFMKK